MIDLPVRSNTLSVTLGLPTRFSGTPTVSTPDTGFVPSDRVTSAGPAVPSSMPTPPSSAAKMFQSVPPPVPDQAITPTREALLQGRDEVLEAAITWIRTHQERMEAAR